VWDYIGALSRESKSVNYHANSKINEGGEHEPKYKWKYRLMM